MSGKMFIVSGIIVVAVIVLVIFIIRIGLFQSSNSSNDKYSGTTYAIGDINQDGTVDAVDENYISSHIGCKKGDRCWNEVVGKTLSGDNPIYASDLDLNHNGIIDQADLTMIKSTEKK